MIEKEVHLEEALEAWKEFTTNPALWTEYQNKYNQNPMSDVIAFAEEYLKILQEIKNMMKLAEQWREGESDENVKEYLRLRLKSVDNLFALKYVILTDSIEQIIKGEREQ